MGIREILASDAGGVFLESGGFGEDVTYAPLGVASNETTITAVVEDVMDPQSGTDGGFNSEMVPGMVKTTRIHVSEDDVSSPAYGDTITQGSTTWRVQQFDRQDGMYVLYCTTGKRMSR